MSSGVVPAEELEDAQTVSVMSGRSVVDRHEGVEDRRVDLGDVLALIEEEDLLLPGLVPEMVGQPS